MAMCACLHVCVHLRMFVCSLQMMQDFHQQQFVQQNQVFHSTPAILFQPINTDTVGSSATLMLR